MEDLVNRYLDKEMDADEQADFEARLDIDPDLNKELEESLRSRLAITASGYLDRKSRLMARPLSQKEAARPLYVRPLVWSVAAVMVILIAFWGMDRLSGGGSNEELFAQYYQPVPFPAGVRDGQENSFEKAQIAYNSANFEEAAIQLESLLADSSFSLRPKAHYFLGLSYLELGNTEQAIDNFSQVLPGSLYGPSAQWHMALAYLNKGDQQKAAAQLKDLLQGHAQPFQNRAAELLEAIDQ